MEKNSILFSFIQLKKNRLHSLIICISIFSLLNHQCKAFLWGSDQWIAERRDIGGGVQSIKTQILRKERNIINPSKFRHYLKNKSLPQSAIDTFKALQYIDIGSRLHTYFTLNQQQTSVESIGVAVHRLSQNQMKVSIIWRKSTANYHHPQTYFRIGKQKYFLFFQSTSYRDYYQNRGLNNNQINYIRNALAQQIAKYDIARQAIQQL